MRKIIRFCLLFTACCFLASNQQSNAANAKKRIEKTPKILYRRKSDVPRGNSLSPDKRYAVWSALGIGEVVTIWLYQVEKNKAGRSHGKPPQELSSRRAVVFQRSFIQGMSWIPGKPHSLVFAISTDNNGGTHGLFLWENGTHLKRLKYTKLGQKGYADINLAGVTEDGKYVIYDYYPDLIDRNPKRSGPFIKRLRLPSAR